MNKSEQNKELYKRTYNKISASSELKEELYKMMHTHNAKSRSSKYTWAIKAAAAVMIFMFLGVTSVYAAEKLNIFGGLFGTSDTAPIEEYVETPDSAAENTDIQGIYTAENDIYSISVDQFMYSKATKYAVVQFTVVNKTGDGRKWCNTSEWNELYQDWEKYDAQEICIGALDEDDINYLRFRTANGISSKDGRIYMQQLDENTAVCQMLINPFSPSRLGNGLPQLIVYESEGTDWNEIMRMDIPVGKSLPCYNWIDEEGNSRLMLSSVDYLLADAPESSISSYTGEIITSEVSVQFKDGSSYTMLSDSQHIIHEFFGTLSERGLWSCFDRVINLDDVVSFTVDGEVFYTEDAVLQQ